MGLPDILIPKPALVVLKIDPKPIELNLQPVTVIIRFRPK